MRDEGIEGGRIVRWIARLLRFAERDDLPRLLAALAFLLGAPSLFVGFQGDDLIHRGMLLGLPPDFPLKPPAWHSLFTFIEGTDEARARLIDWGVFPWYASPDLRASFFRPLTCLTHVIDYSLWPNHAWPMHVHSLLWDAGLVWMATVLLRRILPTRRIAGLAAILYALHAGHAFPASWLANRNAVVAAFFSIAALLAHDRWRRDGWNPGATLGPLCLALGLCSGEAAVAACGYLFAYALFLERERGLRRFATLGAYVAVGAAWVVVYQLLGRGAAGSDMYIDPAADPIRYARFAAGNLPFLVVGAIGPPGVDAGIALSVAALGVFRIVCLAFAVVCGIALWPLIRREPVARFLALGGFLALAPIAATVPSSRLMLPPALGAMGLAAWLIALRFEARGAGARDETDAAGGADADGDAFRRAGFGPISRRIAGPLAILFVAIHLVGAPPQRPVMALGALGMAPLAAAKLPPIENVAQRKVVCANLPSTLLPLYVALGSVLEGRPIPGGVTSLAPSNHAVEIERIDDRTLRVRPEFGYLPLPGAGLDGRPRADAAPFDMLYVFDRLERLTRGGDEPFEPGWKFEVGGVAIGVASITPDGRPAEAIFRFDSPLEDPSRVWLQWDKGYRAWTPPKPGETVRLARTALF